MMARHWRSALALFCLAVVGLLAAQVLLHGTMLEVDRGISFWWAAHRIPWLTEAMRAVSTAHDTVSMLTAAAVLAIWRGRVGDWPGVRGLAAVPTGMLLNVALKDSFRRARPLIDDPLVHLATYSFPSGHAVASTVFYGMVCALVFRRTRSRRWRALAATVAAFMVPLVAFSRVYLGAHFLSDVIAGIAVGTLCVLLFSRLLGPARPVTAPLESAP
jgi:undecaprenyl-diphosphatase